MLGKLLKTEFRATARIFLPFYAGLIFVSLVSRLLGQFTGSVGAGVGSVAYTIGVVVSVFLLIAVVVITFVLMIQRFSKNLIGDEGYLMFTLPVRIDWLIISKLIVAAAWYVASTIVTVVSLVLMSLNNIGEQLLELMDLLQTAFSSGAIALGSVQIALLVLLLVCVSVLGFYMCISLSMLFSRRRGFASIGFYIAYITVVQIIGVIGIAIINGSHARITEWLHNVSAETATNLGLLLCIILALIWAGALYIVTRFMLSRKLNLE